MSSGMFERRDYELQQQRSRLAASVIMPLVLHETGARSVVDIGCGVGTWLAACAELGVTDYFGVDGHHAAELLQIPHEQFRAGDLREPLTFDRSYDLAICLEVAEHLPKHVAAPFVQQLTTAAPCVLFSAAIPGQGGTGHINEQWMSYWAALFAQQEYFPVDAIRPRIWDREDVEWWYRQNVLLYVRRDRLPATYTPPALDMVHPALYLRYRTRLEEAQHRYISGREALGILGSSLRHRLSGGGPQ
jgi:SAM-dependent methyltransferase